MMNGCSASCGPPGRGREARGLLVEELDPGRRLLVGELEVGQLAEVGSERRRCSRPVLRVGDRGFASPAPSRTTYEALTGLASRVA